MSIRQITVLLLTAFVVTACNNTWVKVETEDTLVKDARYSTSLPEGWVKLQQEEHLVATLDGVDIQRVDIAFKEHSKAFEKLEKSSSTELLASELADLYVAELKAADENGLPSLEVVESQPVDVDGNTGFELHLRFVNSAGLRYQMLVTGLATEKGFYTIYYRAPALHFFERDRAVYSSVVSDFKLL